MEFTRLLTQMGQYIEQSVGSGAGRAERTPPENGEVAALP
jgi:hypothetical protein